jgi:hypothetical protein
VLVWVGGLGVLRCEPPICTQRSRSWRFGSHGKVSSVSTVTGRFKRNRQFLVILRGDSYHMYEQCTKVI